MAQQGPLMSFGVLLIVLVVGAGASRPATAAADATSKSVAGKSPAKAPRPKLASPARGGPSPRSRRALRAQRALAAAQAEAEKKEREARVDGKVAVFPFRDDDSPPLRGPVLKVLREHGLTVVTDLRPVDLAEQFRDLAATLGLVAFVEGDVSDVRGKTRVKVSLRSGYSGRRVAYAVIVAARQDIAGEMTDKLWQRLGPALRRARADADKPRRRTRAPMQINAGTPIEDRPATGAPRAGAGKVPG